MLNSILLKYFLHQSLWTIFSFSLYGSLLYIFVIRFIVLQQEYVEKKKLNIKHNFNSLLQKNHLKKTHNLELKKIYDYEINALINKFIDDFNAIHVEEVLKIEKKLTYKSQNEKIDEKIVVNLSNIIFEKIKQRNVL